MIHFPRKLEVCDGTWLPGNRTLTKQRRPTETVIITQNRTGQPQSPTVSSRLVLAFPNPGKCLQYYNQVAFNNSNIRNVRYSSERTALLSVISKIFLFRVAADIRHNKALINISEAV